MTLNGQLWSCELKDIVPSLELLSSTILSQKGIVTSLAIHDKKYSQSVHSCISKNAYENLLIQGTCQRSELAPGRWNSENSRHLPTVHFPPCRRFSPEPRTSTTLLRAGGGGCGVPIRSVLLMPASNASRLKCKNERSRAFFSLLIFLNKRFPHIHC